MSKPDVSGQFVVSLRKGVKPHVLGVWSTTLASFLERQPNITILDILPTGRRVIIAAPQAEIDELRYHWGHWLLIYARGVGQLHTKE